MKRIGKVFRGHTRSLQDQIKEYARGSNMKIGKSFCFLKWCLKGRHKGDLILNLIPGEIVEVRSESEILSTLDENGSLDGLPFTFEMRKYCGKRFRVLKRVDKINVEGVGMRRTKNMFILEGVTCNGEAHGGCDRTCPLIWKEAWLKRARIPESEGYTMKTD
jgi:hypothetical protein